MTRVDVAASDAFPEEARAPNPDPLRAFESAIYGRVPRLSVSVVSKRSVEPCRLRLDARVERWDARVNLRDEARAFDILVASPLTPRPRAVLLVQVFQRAPDGMGHIRQSISHGERLTAADIFIALLLGRHIHAPPLETVLKRGFALAFFCPGDVVPDQRQRAPEVLAQLADTAEPSEAPGALAGWAGLASAVRKTLAADERYADTPIVAWGHSRHGKAALLAAAFDTQFAAVIAHQSGRFGASLTDSRAGETPAQIARVFPHWFCAQFHETISKSEIPPVDQDQLLALIAPRPILLGSASLDFWSDPRAAIRAARRASEAYEAKGQARFAPNPNADYSGGIVHFSRWGGHGVNAADWRHFLGFVEAKFAPESALV